MDACLTGTNLEATYHWIRLVRVHGGKATVRHSGAHSKDHAKLNFGRFVLAG